VLPVIELFGEDDIILDDKHFYLVGGTVYRYIGYGTISSIKPGTICKMGERYYIKSYEPDIEEMYNEKYIVSWKGYRDRTSFTEAIEEVVKNYVANYRKNRNLIKSGNIKIIPSGEIYMPELDPDDDPLERVTKLMLRHIKMVSGEFRGKFDKKHGLDNIKSALNGATKNMSISKFIDWCVKLELDWEVSFDNVGRDVPLPIAKPVVISSTEEFPWMDIPVETKTCFTVPLVDGEDPLKRGIKLVLGEKRIDLKDYRHKSPTPHLLNNMKSALKSRQKMTLPYCMNWCEIIDLSVSFKLINPKDGIWYKMTGYDMTTNDTEMS
jgi:hypothetical protein